MWTPFPRGERYPNSLALGEGEGWGDLVNVALLFSQILNGLATGMLYALMGIGLSIITGVLNIPNFAHGALFALGAYFLFTLIQLLGNFWLALLLAPLGVGILGVLIEWGGIRPLYKAGHDYQLLLTFGLSLIVTEGIIVVWSLLGIDIHRLFTAAFALGCVLAGIAGALTAPIRGLNPWMGVDMLGIAFVVVALASLGNLLGSIVAGLLVGVAQSLVALIWPEASVAVIFAVMAAVLLVRPQGLFGIR